MPKDQVFPLSKLLLDSGTNITVEMHGNTFQLLYHQPADNFSAVPVVP